MCCSTSVSPVNRELAASLLLIGQFTPTSAGNWEREVREDDGTKITVKARIEGDTLKLDLFPRISVMGHHRRISGGVYLEIASRVAEKCGSKIVQSSNIGECVENSDRLKLLADYGQGQRMDWEAVCLGFRTVILGDHLV